MSDKVTKREDEWRAELSPDQFRVLRKKGTEPAFSGAYWNAHDEAMYECAGCGAKLFASETKYDSGSGWPSFTAPAAPDAVATEIDRSHGMTRVEVMCARCGGHLGHVFDDGPGPGGKRFCINSASLRAPPAQK
jgi:peptide-methionine (R)-S-oxide reductase